MSFIAYLLKSFGQNSAVCDEPPRLHPPKKKSIYMQSVVKSLKFHFPRSTFYGGEGSCFHPNPKNMLKIWKEFEMQNKFIKNVSGFLKSLWCHNCLLLFQAETCIQILTIKKTFVINGWKSLALRNAHFHVLCYSSTTAVSDL